MPIGTSKIGVLGAGTVPGGTETFNTPGTFSVPPGVSKVNITGKGGTGNPGNAGNAGNAGNPGSGGAGGGGGRGTQGAVCPHNGAPNPKNIDAGRGGIAWKTARSPGSPFRNPCSPQIYNNINSSNCYAIGGCSDPQFTAVGPNGQGGVAGQAGQAGQAGNPGNTGQSSSGICKTFPGGAGGNAGAAGSAGNAGAAGVGGTGGGNFGPKNPGPGAAGAGGTGGGSGGAGGQNFNRCPLGNCPSAANLVAGATGGGGAGSVNDGQNGGATQRLQLSQSPNRFPNNLLVRGGNSNICAPITPTCGFCPSYLNAGITTSTMGGGSRVRSPGRMDGMAAYAIFNISATAPPVNPSTTIRANFCQISPAPLAPDVRRAGGGGGGTCNNQGICPGGIWNAGGGGGGGRGGAGGAGGTSTGGTGSAATPQTFNCVSVTPGSPYPITVASPGGQVVISWNPQ